VSTCATGRSQKWLIMNDATFEQLPRTNDGRIDQDSTPEVEHVFRTLGLVAFFAAHDEDGVDGEEVFNVRH
jgi:hypothetical protein